jgi:hypothetical protein
LTYGHAHDAAVDGGDTSPVIHDGAFDLAAFDSGNVEKACTMLAPWGMNSWGIEGATITDPGAPGLGRAHFVGGNHQGYLYGYDDTGQVGFVRFVQGNMRSAGSCGAIPWHVFQPVATAGNGLKVDLDLYRDTSNVFGTTDGTLMFGVSLLFSSPDFPSGTDLTGHKPLVMNLIASYQCASMPCAYASAEDQVAYHFQTAIVDAPLGSWTHLTAPLDPQIDAALQHFQLPEAAKNTLKLYEAAFVIEVHHAEGAASIDNYVLSGSNLGSIAPAG